MKTSLQQLGEKYSDSYFEDIARLNIKKPDINPRATQHIEEIIDLIQTLMDKKYAYKAGNDIYFDVAKFKDYGKLSGNKAKALKAGARIDINPDKKNPADFALWKGQKHREPTWNSPWGKGRPGWHAECSAMSMKYLGETFDIHGGGKDLVFPHHENEIAQSGGATGKSFAKYWLHNEWLTVNGKKMSKSLGNFVTTHDAIEKYGARVIRFFLASLHYRSPIDFNEKDLKQAERNLERLTNAIESFSTLRESERKGLDEEVLLQKTKEIKRKFEEAMDDDFNTALAVSAIFDLVKEINKYMEAHAEIEKQIKKEISEIIKTLVEDILGITMERRKPESDKPVENLVKLILTIRQQMRERGDWKTSDEIRSKLQELGFIVEDTTEQSKWKIKQSET
jgi:cysteinyl-tRNA synthetase